VISKSTSAQKGPFRRLPASWKKKVQDCETKSHNTKNQAIFI
jgi:hypothetical protein